MRRWLVGLAVLAGCGGSGPPPAQPDAVLYTIGLSTDPYGRSAPAGFGVLTAPGTARERRLEVRRRGVGGFGGARWIGAGRIAVASPAPPMRPPLVYGLRGARLVPAGRAPVRAREPAPEWSPDGRWIATQPVVPCRRGQPRLFDCYGVEGDVVVRPARGGRPRSVATGELGGWTPDGRVLVGRHGNYSAVDPESAAADVVLDARAVARSAGVRQPSLGPPRWSADGRYLAATIGGRWPERSDTVSGLLIAGAGGRLLSLLRSPYQISMFAWSPVGHRLAYTTSGFPDPHELFVVGEPEARPRRLFATRRHFDWVTWSPDGRRLLLDDEHADAWQLLSATAPARPRRLPRLGGRPVWCCPRQPG